LSYGCERAAAERDTECERVREVEERIHDRDVENTGALQVLLQQERLQKCWDLYFEYLYSNSTHDKPTLYSTQLIVIREGPEGMCQCGDIELPGYLANATGQVSLVLDLLIGNEGWGSSSDPTLNGNLHSPNDIDMSLTESDDDKIRKYHTDYNNNPPNGISFMSTIPSTSRRLHSDFVRLLFLQTHRETDRFFAASGVQLAQTNSGLFHFLRSLFSFQLRTKVGSTLVKSACLRVNLNLDGTPITSRTHTHPSHSETSRLLTSSLFLGVPVPRATQCM
jgi:hypothetical protein